MNILDTFQTASGFLVLAAMFTIVFVFSFTVLPRMKITGFSRWVVAACVAALSIMGILQLPPSPLPSVEIEASGSIIPAILLPYAALGLTLPLLLLLFLLDRIGKWIEHRRFRKEQRKRTIERYVAKDILRPRDKEHGASSAFQKREFSPNNAVDLKPLREAGKQNVRASQTRQH